jgi:glutamate-1-semialdehyde aminotransferase
MNITGCGERYTKEGGELSAEINKELIAQGFCSSPKECNQILRTYVGHGNHVNYSIYAPQNKSALAAVFKLLIERGMKITHGVPISVIVYPNTREEYGNTLFYSPEPSIILEIKQ